MLHGDCTCIKRRGKVLYHRTFKLILGVLAIVAALTSLIVLVKISGIRDD